MYWFLLGAPYCMYPNFGVKGIKCSQFSDWSNYWRYDSVTEYTRYRYVVLVDVKKN